MTDFKFAGSYIFYSYFWGMGQIPFMTFDVSPFKLPVPIDSSFTRTMVPGIHSFFSQRRVGFLSA